MAHRETHKPRAHQVNIRLNAAEIAALEVIGEREDRDKSYLVRWFVRWGMEQYSRVASLAELKSTKIVSARQRMVDKEVAVTADARLNLRKEAQVDYANSGKSSDPRKVVNEKT